MRKILGFVAGVALVAFGANTTFEASFDKSFSADKSVGKPDPIKVNDNIDPFAAGLNGKALKIGPWDNMQTPGTIEFGDRKFGLTYSAAGNINSNQGAVSFWISPVDWDGSNGTNHRMFFTAERGKPEQRFTIYKVLSEPNLYIYCWNGEDKIGSRVCSMANWKKGGWHHIVCNWDKGSMSFFVDGSHVKDFAYPKFTQPFTDFRLGYHAWSYEVGASLMDDFKIFDAPLNKNEVTALFNASLNREKIDKVIALGRGASPVLDGKIGNGEYGYSAVGFMEFPKNVLCADGGKYYLAQDGKKLYVAVKTKVGEKLTCVEGRKHDGELWEDENIELHVKVPGHDQYQFIINAYGAVYDSKNRAHEWNASTLETKSSLEKGTWTIECSLDLAELEGFKDEISVNVARSYRLPDKNTCIIAAKRQLGFSDVDAFITLKFLDKPLPHVDIKDMQMNQNGVKFTAAGDSDLKCSMYCIAGTDKYFETASEPARSATLESTKKIQGGTTAVMRVETPGGELLAQHALLYSPDTMKPFILNYIYTEQDTDEIVFACSSMAGAGERGKLKLQIRTLDGKDVAEKTYTLDAPDNTFNLTYPGGELPYGYYAFTGTLLSPDGTETVVIEEDWVRPEKGEIPDYLDENRIKVQAPWTPLKLDGSKVSTLLNEYVFSDGFLLKSVNANGDKILASQMSLIVNGGELPQAVLAKPVFDNRGDFCHVTQRLAFGGLKVNAESRVDYDGMIKVKLTLQPPEGGIELKSVQMVMPFDGANMEYVNGNSMPGNKSGCSGVLQNEEWDENLFKNFAFWIGNWRAGFGWVTRDMKGWHCKDVEHSLRLLQENGNRVARISFVDTPFVLKEPRTIEFAVMASPARPNSIKVDRTIKSDWHMWWIHSSKYFDYPNPLFNKPRPAGKMNFPYVSIGTAAHCPEWNYYQKEWNRFALGTLSEDLPVTGLAARNRAHWIYGCLNSKSFMNYKIHEVCDTINHPDMDVHNLYFDLVAIRGCTAEGHGCLWTDDFGRKWGACDWEMRRAFFQNIRECLLKKDPQGLLSFHSHNQRLPMVTALCDIQVGGEDFVPQIGTNGNYYDLVDTNVLRAYSVAFGLGPKCIFIPQFERALLFTSPGTKFIETEPKNLKAVRHLLNLLLIHDVDLWYRSPETMKLVGLRKSFGWDENVQMHPFWNADGYFTIRSDSSGGKVVATVFNREGRFLLWMLNDSSAPATAVFNLDFQRLLGKAPTTVKDFYEPERKHAVNGNEVTVEFQDREPVILWFE